MKTLFTFLTATCLITTLHAKIVYLNNELEEPNISENLYTNWSDAYAAVSGGDTIYVIGSNFPYGDILIEKKLTLIGPGFFLEENHRTQINKKHAMFNSIGFDTGSDGAKLHGISLKRSIYGIDFKNPVNNITIENCLITDIDFSIYNEYVYDNITIKKCYIYSSLDINSNRYNGIVKNFVLSNNIINEGTFINDGSNGIISDNLFIGNRLELGTSSSFEFTNNIYLNENENDFTIQPLPDASVSNNISLTGAFGDENDNFSAPQSTLFVDDENTSTDGQYMLSENSPAKGAGTDGTDIGPFDGPDPYRLSGLPNLPNIYELSTGGFVSGDEMSVQIKIKQ